MLLSFLFFIVAYFCGRAIIKFTGLTLGWINHAAALVSGLVLVCILLFFSGFIFPFNLVTVLVVTGVVGVGSVWVMIRGDKGDKVNKGERGDRKIIIKILVLGIFFVVLVVWLFGRALFYGPNGQLFAGDRLVWTDWPLHMGMAANFAWGQNFPPQNPQFSGIPLIYPFFADFLSGVLLVLGASIPLAYGLPGMVLIVTFFGIFVGLGMELYEESGSLKLLKGFKYLKYLKVSMVALFLSLFWGGLGWFYWLQEAFAKEATLVETLLAPPREYTFWQEKGLWFFTFLYSEILPQRAFLFGLPLFFLILFLVENGWEIRRMGDIRACPPSALAEGKCRRGRKYFVIGGILAGILPFFHTHTFLSMWFLSVVMTLIGSMAVFLRGNRGDRGNKGDGGRRKYLEAMFLYFLPFGLLSLVQVPLFFSGHHEFPFHFGWMKENENFFLFWFKNTGFFIPLYLLGLWKGKFGGFGKLVGWSAWILFILPNLFQFAPWGYDNLKIFTFWYLIGSVFVARGLYWIWGIRGIGKIGTIILFLSLTLSGIVEVARIIPTNKVQIGLWSKEDQELGVEIRNKTAPQSVFLTASIHDHPVEALAGRKIVIGYPGNMWSWGIEGWDTREKDVHTMYRNLPEALNLWKKYGINYIIVSDRERWFEKNLDEGFIAKNTELFLTNGTTKIFKVR